MSDEWLKKDEGEFKFTGYYGMEIKTCSDVGVDIPTDKRTLNWSHTNAETSIPALKDWANQHVEGHLMSHRDYRTSPCQPTISAVFAVHKDSGRSGKIVWVPVSQAI